jgi:hypothetical protein
VAEQHHRRALAIAERLGDQAGVATTCAQLGALYTERGRTAEAVPYTLAALAFFAQARSPNVGFCVRSLGEQRRALGDDRFSEVLAQHLDPDSIDTVLSLTRPDAGGTGP